MSKSKRKAEPDILWAFLLCHTIVCSPKRLFNFTRCDLMLTFTRPCKNCTLKRSSKCKAPNVTLEWGGFATHNMAFYSNISSKQSLFMPRAITSGIKASCFVLSTRDWRKFEKKSNLYKILPSLGFVTIEYQGPKLLDFIKI